MMKVAMLKYAPKDIYLGTLYDFGTGGGLFKHIAPHEYSCLEDEGIPEDVLCDILEGIREEVIALSRSFKFDIDSFTKYWINDLTFEII